MKHARRSTGLFGVALLAAAGTAMAAEPGAEVFDVLEYRVLGNSTLPPLEIERAVYPHLGPARSLADIENARAAIEQAYRAAGFSTVFVDVPEQQVDRGIVRLRVSEGRIDRVRIHGTRYFSNGRIRESLPALAHGAVPRLAEVQAQLAALNSQTRDRAIVPVLKAGRTPGTIDVELQVEDALPLHGSLEVNDRYTADTSRLRLTASLSYDNLFQKHHSLSLQYQTAPEAPEETRAIVASYLLRFASLPRSSLVLYAVDSRSDISVLGSLSVLGNGRIYGARLVTSLPQSARYFHGITFGLDYKDFLEDIRLDEDEALQTPISYLDWSAAYSGTLRATRTSTTFSLGANLGVRGLFNGDDEFANKRFRGSPGYFYVRGGVRHTLQLLPRLALFGRLEGQVSGVPLVSNEQLIIGGTETVRGYLESTHLGDVGASGTLELRHDLLSTPLGLPPGSGYLFAFADGGRVALHDPLPAQPMNYTLGSAGMGLRINGWRGLDLALDLAAPLKSVQEVERGEMRAHFTLRYSF